MLTKIKALVSNFYDEAKINTPGRFFALYVGKIMFSEKQWELKDYMVFLFEIFEDLSAEDKSVFIHLTYNERKVFRIKTKEICLKIRRLQSQLDNFQSKEEANNKPIKDKWETKCEEAAEKLKTLLNNPEFTKFML